MKRPLLAFFLLFVLLFPLAWANSTVYSEAQALAETKARLAEARRNYNLTRSRLAREESLTVIEQRAVRIGMGYPEVIAIDKNKGAGPVPGHVGPRDSLALGMAPVVGRE